MIKIILIDNDWFIRCLDEVDARINRTLKKEREYKDIKYSSNNPTVHTALTA